MKGLYWSIPSHEFDQNNNLIIRKPEQIPQLPPGKKRVTMMGDSLLVDDEDTGWSHHLAYKSGKEKLPFDFVNLARSGATIAPPAHIFGMKDGEGKNCYGGQAGKEYYYGHYHYQDTVHGKNRWELAAASKPSYVILQIGANDVTPMCSLDDCHSESSPYFDKTLKGQNRSQCFYEGSPNEDGQFEKIKQGLKKMVVDIKAFDSKPQILMITPPPYLDYCAKPEWKANGFNELVSKWWAKLTPIYEKVAEEENVKLLNLNQVYKGKEQKELCENQKLSIENHEGPINLMDSMHWGRPEIVQAVTEMLLLPEAAILAQEAEKEKAVLTEAKATILEG